MLYLTKNFYRILILLALVCSSYLPGATLNLFDENSINNSPRSLKIKLPFDGAKVLIGVSKDGYIKDKLKTYTLKPLIKYQLKINAGGGYDLALVKGGKTLMLGALQLPATLSSTFGDAPVYFDKSWYHGQINFAKDTTGIISVNILDLEQAVWGILSPFVRVNDSVGSIQAAAVIIRSSLYSFTMTSLRDQYHLNAADIGYTGLEGEKDFVIKLIGQTEGEVLFTPAGELLYTPLRVTATEGSLPFELIGQETKAWEKVLAVGEAERILDAEGYATGPVISFEQKAFVSAADVFAVESGPFLSIEGANNSIQMSLPKAQTTFKLPSPFFRVYSFRAEDGQVNLQFIGSLPNFQTFPTQPVLNIVRLIYEKTNPMEDYKHILKKMYPAGHLSRI
jgi:hypothetical protein